MSPNIQIIPATEIHFATILILNQVVDDYGSGGGARTGDPEMIFHFLWQMVITTHKNLTL